MVHLSLPYLGVFFMEIYHGPNRGEKTKQNPAGEVCGSVVDLKRRVLRSMDTMLQKIMGLLA